MPPLPRRPAPAPRSARPARPAPAKRTPWGWLEWFVLSQTILSGFLFVPGISAARTLIRVATYGVGLVAWIMIARSGRVEQAPGRFVVRPWLVFCAAWLCLSVLHPNSYSFRTAVAQVALYLAIMSPAFWVGRVLRSPRQLTRLMAVLFLCNALSAVLGVAQVYRPDTFNPPVIPAMSNRLRGQDLQYETADGRKVIRPCGLTDTPGSAGTAGTVTAVLGLCFALRPIGLLRRAACVALAFGGLAALYFTQVRMALVVTIVGLVTVWVLLILQKNFKQALMLAAGGVATVSGAMTYVVYKVGPSALKRFATLVEENPASLYDRNRGGYVRDALEIVLPQYPLGYGLGWWGMINGIFGTPGRLTPVWVEVMIPAWVYDGGLPLLVGYGGAVLVALYNSARVALTCPDREVAFWAAVAVALNLGIAASCMSFVTFLSPMGLTFWVTAAAVNTADRQARASAAASARPSRGRGPAPGPRPAVAR